jgi:hypothetical protein
MLKDSYWSRLCHKGAPGTGTAAHYLLTLQTICHALCEKHPQKKKIILQDNTWLHTACLNVETIQKDGWNFSPIHPRVWALPSSDYHLFQFVKDQVQDQHTATSEAV